LSFSFQRLAAGLQKTQANWVARVREVLGQKQRLDPEVLASLEETLLAGDLGVDVAGGVLDRLRSESAQIAGSEQALAHLQQILAERLVPPERAAGPRARPHVTVLVGVNGTGKTTTAGKLAYRFVSAGDRVLVAGCDTFRAAALDQLKWWCDQAGADVVLGRPDGDPSAVAFDAMRAAVSRGSDRVLVDTAGRLHTRTGLMAELEKLQRVIRRVLPEAPHEVLLVLDATTGQNGLAQAREFHRSLPLSGVVLTKLDGTARGGIVFAIREALGVPVRYVGLGEQLEDLDEFDPHVFVKALFSAHPAVSDRVAAGGS
jgi:fused signal recognition particle receptor